jgi:hypothetical protein
MIHAQGVADLVSQDLGSILLIKKKSPQNGWENFHNRSKIYQHLSLQDTPKFTQIGIFGLKIYDLATLVS